MTAAPTRETLLAKLAGAKQHRPDGTSYWHYHDLQTIFGYTARPTEFERALGRARGHAFLQGHNDADLFKHTYLGPHIGDGYEISHLGAFFILTQLDIMTKNMGVFHEYFKTTITEKQ